MKEADVRHLFLTRFGIRLEDEMCDYVAHRLRTGQPVHAGEDALAVMGGHAKTGAAIRFHTTAGDLRGPGPTHA